MVLRRRDRLAFAAMMPRRLPAQRLSHRALCALLGLVMVLAPMAALVGEVHEFDHAVQGDTHFSVADSHTGSMPPAPGDDTGDGPLHALAHASQCCGQATAELPSPPLVILFGRSPDAIASTPRFGDWRVAFLPFRPPIIG